MFVNSFVIGDPPKPGHPFFTRPRETGPASVLKLDQVAADCRGPGHWLHGCEVAMVD